ncbi:hypothetical protein I5Q82_05795 [Acutalibacter muris]|uniref:Uncharacterized protein n=1 Tax=Acutalibacter muris TaxID=1796620 RepID=A0A1Z2XU43_9FIRM|nr:hypothetical protein [Acutalibacter muris]ANU54852.1 hypothetical protein A4V00_12955 [Hungateiclostridiaceae bacterium KB18]ASB41921.1 hypothetical protein ADH66_15415 [Acutalibacter muris]QQR31187.1 hypothetical protein I5Q82_05795 [Acutalibacter muris]
MCAVSYRLLSDEIKNYPVKVGKTFASYTFADGHTLCKSDSDTGLSVLFLLGNGYVSANEINALYDLDATHTSGLEWSVPQELAFRILANCTDSPNAIKLSIL